MLINAGGLVYGTIIVAALLASESARNETYGETVGAVAIGLLLYWVARSYAEYAGERLQQSQPFTAAGLARRLGHEAPVLVGAVIPLLVLLICWAVGVSLSGAVLAGVWSSAVTLVAIELIDGIRSSRSGAQMIAPVTFGALLGLLVLALRVLLH